LAAVETIFALLSPRKVVLRGAQGETRHGRKGWFQSTESTLQQKCPSCPVKMSFWESHISELPGRSP